MTTTTLPNKLSDLLELAVHDVQKCEAEPKRFVLDMGKWHSPKEDGVCALCMAGAVMAQTMAVPDKEYGVWSKVQAEPKLVAINEMRVADFEDAADTVGLGALSDEQLVALECADGIVRNALPDEDEAEDGEESANFHAPWETYLKAAAILREAGL